MKKKILLINGANLNSLGTREPEVYGYDTLSDIENNLQKLAQKLDYELICFQSNHEGAIIDKIYHEKAADCAGIIINPGAFTHYSIAIMDAIAAVNLPAVEIHISNIYKREKFRHRSYLAPVCIGQITGLGIYGYEAAFMAIHSYLNK